MDSELTIYPRLKGKLVLMYVLMLNHLMSLTFISNANQVLKQHWSLGWYWKVCSDPLCSLRCQFGMYYYSLFDFL